MGPAKFDLLISTGTFYPDIGGPPTYLKQLAGALFKQNISVQVLTFGQKKDDFEYPVRYVSRQHPLIWRLPLYIFLLWKSVLKSTHWYVNDYGFPAWLISLLTQKPYTLKIVGDFAWEWSKRHLNYQKTIDEFQNERPLVGKLVQLVQKTYASKAKKIIVPSLYLKKIVSGWGISENKIEVVYNSITPKKFDTAVKNQVRGFQKPILCTVARLVDWKGIDHVLKTLVNFKNRSWQYLIIGTGPDQTRLEKMVTDYQLNDHVLFLGNLSADGVNTVFSEAELFLLLSGYEGLPHVVLEALLQHVPCIVSDSGGFSEVIASGQNGYLLNLKESSFEKNLNELLERFFDQKNFLTKAQVNLPEKFQFENMLKQTKEIIL